MCLGMNQSLSQADPKGSQYCWMLIKIYCQLPQLWMNSWYSRTPRITLVLCIIYLIGYIQEYDISYNIWY